MPDLEVVKMTGNEIMAIGGNLHLTTSDFARLLCTHESTLYRWKKMGDERIKLNGLREGILYALEMMIESKTGYELAHLSTTTWLYSRGPMYALYRLLNEFYGQDRAK